MRDQPDSLSLSDLPVQLRRTEIFGPASSVPIASVNRDLFRLLSSVEPPREFAGIADVLRSSPRGAKQLFSSCPFLLCDLRFNDRLAWSNVVAEGSASKESIEISAGEMRDLMAVVHSAAVVAWYVVRRWPAEASLLIGVTPDVAGIIRKLDVSFLCDFVWRHYDWLTLRFEARSEIWPQLLMLADLGGESGSQRLRERLVELCLGQTL